MISAAQISRLEYVFSHPNSWVKILPLFWMTSTWPLKDEYSNDLWSSANMYHTFLETCDTIQAELMQTRTYKHILHPQITIMNTYFTQVGVSFSFLPCRTQVVSSATTARELLKPRERRRRGRDTAANANVVSQLLHATFWRDAAWKNSVASSSYF